MPLGTIIVVEVLSIFIAFLFFLFAALLLLIPTVVVFNKLLADLAVPANRREEGYFSKIVAEVLIAYTLLSEC